MRVYPAVFILHRQVILTVHNHAVKHLITLINRQVRGDIVVSPAGFQQHNAIGIAVATVLNFIADTFNFQHRTHGAVIRHERAQPLTAQ